MKRTCLIVAAIFIMLSSKPSFAMQTLIKCVKRFPSIVGANKFCSKGVHLKKNVAPELDLDFQEPETVEKKVGLQKVGAQNFVDIQKLFVVKFARKFFDGEPGILRVSSVPRRYFSSYKEPDSLDLEVARYFSMKKKDSDEFEICDRCKSRAREMVFLNYCKNNDLDSVKKYISCISRDELSRVYGTEKEGAIYSACKNGNLEMLKFLFSMVSEYGLDILPIYTTNDKQLFYWARYHKNYEMMVLLVNYCWRLVDVFDTNYCNTPWNKLVHFWADFLYNEKI